MNREQAKKYVYSKSRWTKLSKRARELQPMCMMCETEPSKIADHIHEVRDEADALNLEGSAWDLNNIWSLCDSCHKRKSDMVRKGTFNYKWAEDRSAGVTQNDRYGDILC